MLFAFTVALAAAKAKAPKTATPKTATPPARENVCFTAHAQTTLVCRELPTPGPLAVYADGWLPQRARTLTFKRGNKLCESKACTTCVQRGGGSGKCASKTSTFTVTVSAANSDLPKPFAVLLGLALVAVPQTTSGTANRDGAIADSGTAVVKATGGAPPPSGALKLVVGLLKFARSWWFPWVAAFGTGLNLFTLVLTAATVVLFLAAVLARKERWVSTAFANAVGAVVGSAALLYLLREQGETLMETAFPTVLASPAWAKAYGLLEAYGAFGMFLISCLPIFLHPVIVFGVISGMSNVGILAIILVGRTVKYLVMAWVTANAPSALRFFGVKADLLAFAEKAIDDEKYGDPVPDPIDPNKPQLRLRTSSFI